MKKLLLIPVLFLSLAINATNETISPESAESDNNIRAALNRSADTIFLNPGTYIQVNQIHLRRNVVIMAASSEKPVIRLKYYCDFTAGAKVTIDGIKFDGSSSGAQGILIYDDSRGKELHLNNCEFANFAKDVITCTKDTCTVDSCIINNCYFHDNTYSAVYFQKSSIAAQQTCYGLKVTNSTFANIDVSPEYRAVIDLQTYDREATDDIEVVVDHCTFYNNPVKNYDYSAIRTRIANRTTVSNCIFMHPTAQEWYATNVWAGSVINCLAYNFNKGYSAPTKTEANTGNPLFTDAANGDFSLAGNYVTGNVSPARNAATDGSDLGDPRWYTAATYPTTDFASPGYVFKPAKAMSIGASIEKNTHYGEEDAYLRYTGSTNTSDKATWIIQATRACYVNVTINMADNAWEGNPDANYQNGKHIFGVELWNSNNVRVDTVAEGLYENGSSLDGYSTYPTINLGSVFVPEAGVYTIKLLNCRSWSKCGVASITLTYTGGATVNIPNAAVPFDDAILSASATRATNEIHFNGVDQYAKWNVHATAGIYTFAFNVVGSNYGKYKLDVTDSGDNNIFTYTQGKDGSGTVSISNVFFPSDGDYVIQLANVNSGANGYLTSLAVTAAEDVFVIDENETDASVIAGKDNTSWKALLKRTFKGGVYSSFCIPVEPSSSEMTNAFGAGYKLLELESATMDGSVLNLNFKEATAVLAGKPYLIKPVADVANPIFNAHNIHNYTYNNTVSSTNADFIGTFVKKTITANTNNLFLGADNKLYYSENSVNIKGMRAYFQVHGTGGLAPKARIIFGGQVATDIDLVNDEWNIFGKDNVSVKTIENGQLIIIRDGVKYNVMGARIQ